MPSFTLAQLRGASINLGDLTLSEFKNDGSSIDPNLILVDTIEGDNLGLSFRVAPNVASTAQETQTIGIDFQLNLPAFILEGASMSLDSFGFSTVDGGGFVTADLSQQRAVPNIGINLALSNEPGGTDLPSGTDVINRGPVGQFKFEYDLTVDPNNGVAVTIGSSAVLFDLADDAPATLPDGFDGLQYIASHADLVAAFGANRTAGEQHYLGFGVNEGRAVDVFSETQYLANHADLRAAFGTDVNAATQHFITNGLNEGRNDDAAQINGLQYIASHSDLIQAFGANAAAGQSHYASNGQSEGRAVDTFNETQYLANHADLRAAFGDDAEAATQHFIQFGFLEGRNDFLV